MPGPSARLSAGLNLWKRPPVTEMRAVAVSGLVQLASQQSSRSAVPSALKTLMASSSVQTMSTLRTAARVRLLPSMEAVMLFRMFSVVCSSFAHAQNNMDAAARRANA